MGARYLQTAGCPEIFWAAVEIQSQRCECTDMACTVFRKDWTLKGDLGGLHGGPGQRLIYGVRAQSAHLYTSCHGTSFRTHLSDRNFGQPSNLRVLRRRPGAWPSLAPEMVCRERRRRIIRESYTTR